VSNINPSAPLWLFDLDNTLHNASHAIFPAIMGRMNALIARALAADGQSASAEAVDRARTTYWRRYGATLLGMMHHHGTRADDFLRETHAIGELAALLRYERGLARMLRLLPGRKILLTNAPLRYSREVMRHLGVQRQFSHHIAIESMRVHGQLRPKPSTLMLRRLLRRQQVSARRVILVEDTLANLRAAKSVGMRTAWVTGYLSSSDPIGAAPLPGVLNRPAYVDVKVKSVHQLRKRLHRLR
jgi:putative hydrolase of the HAD superfamily